MYESREASESRGFSYPSYFGGSSESSESRDYGESRVEYNGGYGESSESRVSESRPSYMSTTSRGTTKPVQASKYNSFDDIDTLIEQLEVTIPVLEGMQNRGEKYSQALKRRQQQLEKLKQIKEDRIISEIEEESDEFDKKIEGVMKLTKKPVKKQSTPKRSTSSGSSWGGWGSESRDSGESRW